MTLAQITALIAANIDTTGRRLTTGIKMREVLNGIVAYLTGIPSIAVSGITYINEADGWEPKSLLGTQFSVPQGGELRVFSLITVSRGQEWGEITISGTGDSEFTEISVPATIAEGECMAGVVLDLDTYAAGTYTYTLTIGGIDRSIIIEVEA
jgi:hypothetical protein